MFCAILEETNEWEYLQKNTGFDFYIDIKATNIRKMWGHGKEPSKPNLWVPVLLQTGHLVYTVMGLVLGTWLCAFSWNLCGWVTPPTFYSHSHWVYSSVGSPFQTWPLKIVDGRKPSGIKSCPSSSRSSPFRCLPEWFGCGDGCVLPPCPSLTQLLNCIMDMVEKTRRSLTVLRRCQEADREELNYWIRRYSDAEDLKKGGGGGGGHSRQQSPVNPDPVALGSFPLGGHAEQIVLTLSAKFTFNGALQK